MIPNFCEALYQRLQQQPDAVCITWPGATPPTRGRDLLDLLTAFRWQLSPTGEAAGQRVVLLAPLGPGVVAALLGTMAAGAIPVLPPASASGAALLRLVRRLRPTAVVCSPQVAKRWGWLLRRLGCRVVVPAVAAPSLAAWPAPVPVPPEQAALLSSTSGSTGVPKVVQRSHRVLTAQHQVLKAVFPPWLGQVDFPLFPNILLHNLSVGTPSVLPAVAPGLAQFDPALVVAQLRQHQPATLTGNVHYFRRLLPQLLAQPQPGVRAVGVGGSPVPEWLLGQLGAAFPGAQVVAIYGSSEAEPIALRPVLALQPQPAYGYYAGAVVEGLNCRLEPLGQLHLPDGRTVAVGEVQVRGAHVAAPGWLATGDFGYVDEHNHLWLTGRLGNATICRGVQHYQLEHVLQHVPGVEQVAARPRGAGFAVWLQGRPSATALAAALQVFPPGLVLRFHYRRRLPLDARHLSKIRYEKLR